MQTISTFTNLLSHSLVWALAYSLWQGLVIFAGLFCVLKALQGISARIKYLFAYGAISTLFLWFVNTWVEQFERLKVIAYNISQTPINSSKVLTYYATYKEGITSNPTQYLTNALHYLERHNSLIISIYCIGLLFMMVRFSIGMFKVNSLQTKSLIEPGERLQQQFALLKSNLNISGPIRLFLSDKVNTPVMLGFLKPIILLPIATINHLNTEQVESILLHELAHIKRNDYLFNVLQTIIETILFFNPFVWFISTIIRREREHCCDDIVVATTTNPLPYAKALALLETQRIAENNLQLAATGNKKQLFNRIKRIMEMKKNNISNGQFFIITLALIALTLSVALVTFTPSYAQKSKKQGKDSVVTKSYVKYTTVIIDSNGNRQEITKESNDTLSNTCGKVAGFKVVVDKQVNADDVNIDDVKIILDSTVKGNHSQYLVSNNGKVSTVMFTGRNYNMNIDSVLENAIKQAEKQIVGIDWNNIKLEIQDGLGDINKTLADSSQNGDEAIKRIMSSIQILDNDTDILIDTKNSDGKNAPKHVLVVNASKHTTLTGQPEVHTSFEAMIDDMENDGLLDKGKSIFITKEDNILTINGVQQPASVLEKYKANLSAKSIILKGFKGNLKINIKD